MDNKIEVSLNFNNLSDDERDRLFSLIEKAALLTNRGKGLIGRSIKADTKIKIINIEAHRKEKFVCLNEYIGKTGHFPTNVIFKEGMYESPLIFDDEYMNVIDERNGRLCWRYDEIEIVEE